MSCFALPPELFSLIFSFLSQDQDILALRSCSLVHRSFRPIAQRLLFEHIFLLPEPRRPVTALAPRSYSLAPQARPCYIERGHIQSDREDQIPHTTCPNRQASPHSKIDHHPCQDPNVAKYMRSESLPPYKKDPVFCKCTCGCEGAKTILKDCLGSAINETTHKSPCWRLLRLLIASPILASYVKRLTIVDGQLFPRLSLPFSASDPLLALLTRSNAIDSFTLRDKINGPPWIQNTSSHVFSSLFSLLGHSLQKLDLVFSGCGPKLSWNTLPIGFRKSLCALFRGCEPAIIDGIEQEWANQLEKVEIRNMKWDDPCDAIEVFGDMGKGVREVVLRGVRIGKGDDSGSTNCNVVQTPTRNTPEIFGIRERRGRSATKHHGAALYVNQAASMSEWRGCESTGHPIYQSNVQRSQLERIGHPVRNPNPLPLTAKAPSRRSAARLEILCVTDHDFAVGKDVSVGGSGKESLSLLRILLGPSLSANVNGNIRSEGETLHEPLDIMPALKKVVLPDLGELVSLYQLSDMLK